jgi:ABC-type uncharacterized transport system permease subunit
MKTFSLVLSYTLPVLYLATVLLYFGISLKRKRTYERITTYFLVGLIVIYLLRAIVRMQALGVVPVSTAFDALSSLAFAILVVYLIIELSFRNWASGFFIVTFAFVVEIISAFNYNWQPETNELLSNASFAAHASLNILGYTALSLSAIYALMYVIQNHNVRNRRFNVLYDQLPALTHLEMMSIRSVLIGILTMGGGIFLGHLQTSQAFGKFWLTDPKVVVTDVIWLAYFLGYVGARLFRWRGRRMAYLALSGFTVLTLGGIVVVIFAESFHEFF